MKTKSEHGAAPNLTTPNNTNLQQNVDALLRWPTVQQLTGISRTTAWRLEKLGQFPSRVRVSAGITAWRKSEILTFIQTRRAV
jgi:predicted DNA-binding transcriptional regulator AlpA